MPKPSPAPNARAHPQMPLARLALAAALGAAPISAVQANNYGESASWQFEGPQDLVAQVAARDLIERRRGGVFAAPVYTTTIARQYNCSIGATAIGNSGSLSATANSPSTTGATSTATGNEATSAVTGEGSDADIANGQWNGGAVGSTLNGATTVSIAGSPSQALNSSQTNSGTQGATVTASNACAFGVLN